MGEGYETEVESNCGRRIPEGDIPDEVAPRCKGEASAWVYLAKGTRRYLCEDHVREVVRFVDADNLGEAGVPEHPVVRPCESCRRLTWRDDLFRGECRDCSDVGPRG